MRAKLIVGLMLFLGGFLAGFVPQALRSRDLQQELSASEMQLHSCQSAERLSALRQTAAMMYLETTRKNYGIARDYAARFFDRAQQIASSTLDSQLRAAMAGVLPQRDQITADLAMGSPAVVEQMQSLLLKLDGEAAK